LYIEEKVVFIGSDKRRKPAENTVYCHWRRAQEILVIRQSICREAG